MTNDLRIHPVPDADARAAAVGQYRRDGYAVVEEGDAYTELRYYSRGSLLAHLALFFTVGWLSFGLLNAWYAHRTKKKTHDRVRVTEQ